MDGARFFLFRLSFIFLFLGGVGMLVRTTALYAQWGCVFVVFYSVHITGLYSSLSSFIRTLPLFYFFFFSFSFPLPDLVDLRAACLL